jgi:hypothetical protein
VLSGLLEKRPPRHLLLIHAAVLLWSPFVAVGLLPFTAVACWMDRPHALSWPNVLGAAALGVPVGTYFLAHFPQEYAGWLFASFSGVADWAKYLAFLATAVGLLLAALWALKRRYGVPSAAGWRLACLATGVLVAVTLVDMGKFNDWTMRASAPALFVLDVAVAAAIVAAWPRARAAHRVVLALFVLLAAERPLKLYTRTPFGLHAAAQRQTTIVSATEFADGLVNLPDSRHWDFAAQYLGSRDSLFAKGLMRRAGD